MLSDEKEQESRSIQDTCTEWPIFDWVYSIEKLLLLLFCLTLCYSQYYPCILHIHVYYIFCYSLFPTFADCGCNDFNCTKRLIVQWHLQKLDLTALTDMLKFIYSMTVSVLNSQSKCCMIVLLKKEKYFRCSKFSDITRTMCENSREWSEYFLKALYISNYNC